MLTKTLIYHLVHAEEITYKSKLVTDTTSDIYFTDEVATLNKWHPKNKAEDVSLTTFKRLLYFSVIEPTSGNYENGEQHYQLAYRENILKTLNECLLKTSNTEFESIFSDILLKYERKEKLKALRNR